MEVTSELTHDYYHQLIKYTQECEDRLLNGVSGLPEKSDDVKDIMSTGHHGHGHGDGEHH